MYMFCWVKLNWKDQSLNEMVGLQLYLKVTAAFLHKFYETKTELTQPMNRLTRFDVVLHVRP